MPKPSSAVSSVATEEATAISSVEKTKSPWMPGGLRRRRFVCPGTVVGLVSVGLDGRAIDGQPVSSTDTPILLRPPVDGVGGVADLTSTELAGVGRQVEGGVDRPARFRR